MDKVIWRQDVYGHCKKCGKNGYSTFTVYDNRVLVDGKWKLEELIRCNSCKTAGEFEPIIDDHADASNFHPKRTWDDYYRRSSFGSSFENRSKFSK
jgi:hypothetical protein